jgi:hypothetical protein
VVEVVVLVDKRLLEIMVVLVVVAVVEAALETKQVVLAIRRQ